MGLIIWFCSAERQQTIFYCYMTSATDFVVVIESFRIQRKTPIKKYVRIQNKTVNKTDGPFAALILKSSCANLV